MSFVIAAPDLVAMATEDLAGIGASLTAANAAAAVPTSGLLAAAGDEVSAAIAALFSSHGQQYQAMSAQAAAFHARFVQALAGAMGAYAAAEAANASPLQTLEQGLLGAINAPAAALSGRPFIGNGIQNWLGRVVVGINEGRHELDAAASLSDCDCRTVAARLVK